MAKKDNRQPVTTLKDQDWFTKALMKPDTDLGCTVMSQAVSNIQVFMQDKRYYAEFGKDGRAGLASFNNPGKPFDVAASTDCSDTSFRKAVATVLVEKARNDIETVSALVAHMKKDGILPEEFEDISFADLVERMQDKN